MARVIFPWVLLFSLALALLFVLVGRYLKRPQGRTRIVIGILCLIAFLVTLVVASLGISGDIGVLVWSTEFFSLSSSGPVVKLGLELGVLPVAICWTALLLLLHAFIVEPALAPVRSSEKKRFADVAVYESMIIGFAAIALAWFSSSLWTALLAQMMAALAGGAVLNRLSSGRAALGTSFSSVSLTYIRERGAGIALVSIGAAIASVSGASLDWNGLGTQQLPQLGVLLVVFGALVQMQLFPAIGWPVLANQRHPVSERVSLLIAMPSIWVSFAVLYRLSSLRADTAEIQFLTTLVFVFLNALSALGAPSAQGAFSLLYPALAGLSAAGLIFAGPRVAGTLFVVTQIILWCAALLGGVAEELKGRPNLRRVLVGLLVVAAFGGPGFATAAAFQSLIGFSGNPLAVSLVLICWVVLSMAFMRLLASSTEGVSEGVGKELGLFYQARLAWRIVPVFLITVLSLSILWCGDPVGSFSSGVEIFGPDWSTRLFGAVDSSVGEQFLSATWVWMAVLSLALFFGAPERLARLQMKFLSLPEEGYRLRQGFEYLFQAVRVCVQYVSAQPRRAFISALLGQVAGRTRDLLGAVATLDRWLQGVVDSGVRGLVEVPAKALQLLHSGGIQLYLLFTVGFVLAMLLHFFGQMSH